MNESELGELLFESGISSCSGVSELSGRGVGLNVVYDSVKKSGGSIEIVTEKGKGSLFTVKFPVTVQV